MGNWKHNSNANRVQVTRIRGFQCARLIDDIGNDSSDSMTNSSIAAALRASRCTPATELSEGQRQVHATQAETNRLTVEGMDDCRMQAKRQRVHLRRVQQSCGPVDVDRREEHTAPPIGDADASWEMPKVCVLCRRTLQSDEANCDCCCSCVDQGAAEPTLQLRDRYLGVRWMSPETPCDERQASGAAANTIFAADYDPDGLKGGGGGGGERRRQSGSFCSGDRDERCSRQAIDEQPPRASRLHPKTTKRLAIESLLIWMHMLFMRYLSTFGSLAAATCNSTATANSQRPRGAGNRPIKRLNTPYDSLYVMPHKTQHHRQHNHQQEQQQQLDTLETKRRDGQRKSLPNVAPLFSMLLGVTLLLVLLPPVARGAHTPLLANGLADSAAGLATAVTPAIHRPAPADMTAPLRSFGGTGDSDGALKPFVLPPLKAFAGNEASGGAPYRAANKVAADEHPGRLATKEYVCKSIDLRNVPAELEQLRNCTVIEGFLIVTLMNTGGQIREFNESFPLLTEVTEYLIIYRVHNLRSVSQIFPNLSIIRGQRLLEGFALIIEFNPHLEDIGLSKLLTVRKGGVRIANNLSLCFVETVDWSLITSELVHRKNRAVSECPKCPGDDGPTDRGLSCGKRDGKRRCWSSTACQTLCPKECPNNCVDEHTCCNPNCTGGCLPHDRNACIGCDGYSHNLTSCVKECPRDLLKYLNRRCLSVETCKQIRWKLEGTKQMRLMPFRDECLTTCPAGYIKVNSTCVVCDTDCASRCKGGIIDSAERAKAFAPCTHIVEDGLTINIKRGGRHLMNDLMFGLSQIKVVDTFIKVHHTYGLFSLEFFKSLEAINGKIKYDGRYSLYVLENNDLETLWGPNRTVRINDGRVFFHFNPKLCISEIENLYSMMKDNHTFDKNEVALDTNGEKGSCNTEVLPVRVVFVDSSMASVEITKPLFFDDERSFIGYLYYSMESKDQNATKSGHRVCDDGWTVSEPIKDTTSYFVGLKPYTQYAFYVKTLTISSERRNAQSEISYFTTKADQPQQVSSMTVVSDSPTSINVSWTPPFHIYGKLDVYVVRVEFDSRIQKMDSRNYCQNPVVITNPPDLGEDTEAKKETKKAVDDCQCDAKKMDTSSDTDDVTIHEEINFENMLQNHIYVKVKKDNPEFALDDGNEIVKRERRSLNSFLVRHMRALPNESTNTIDESTTASPPKTVTTTTTNVTAVNEPYEPVEFIVYDKNGEYVERRSIRVNGTEQMFTVPDLKHFGMYKVTVRACREAEEELYPISKTAKKKERCSDEEIRYIRTLKMDNVDKVENLRGVVENTNTSRSTVRLTWDPPSRPNGDVVTYTIKFLQKSTDDAALEKKCISELDFRKMPAGYLLTGLPAGNYSITVSANSLAGDGIDSEPIYVYIPPTTLSNTAIALLCLAPLVLLACIAYGVYYCRKKLLAPPSDLKMFPTVNPYYMSTQYIADDWEVPRDRVIQLSPLGQGSFGMVYEGIVKGYNNSSEDTPCAIKTVNENATDRERMNFLNEASVMKEFDTYHVVRLLGVCSLGQPALVIMELMKNGDLKCYLRAHRNEERDELGMLGMEMRESLQPPPLQRIYQMAIEIADGMAYLSAKKFVHRDLAARNCMVAADLTVKIGDFGMTRDIYETDYYRKGTKGLLPVRWMPPESLRDGVYSSASDVFSYGVVLWEMATLASQPYQGMSNEQVLRYVIDGGVMERPVRCPDKLYRLMQRCWHHRPSARPTFMEIITSMADIAEPHFQRVSFYHSVEGEEVRLKEEKSQHSGQIFSDPENNMDDARTPLRAGEYGEYKLHVENNSSVEHAGDIDDDHPHSPYSLGSANIISSTPDGQSKNSYNLSQMSHTNPAAPLNSAPTASATSGSAPHILQHPHTHPYQRQLHLPAMPPRYHPAADEASAYVQPDFHEHEFPGADNGGPAGGGRIPRTSETDERGYEVYDPSPNYREHVPGYEGRPGDHDDEHDHYDDDGGVGLHRTGSKLSGGENLLPRPAKGQRTRHPIITPMSSSMPDEVTSVPMPSSLHPSTASAASSNASSTAAAAATTGLKKAVADAMHNVGNSLMPSRLRNMNRRFFHKRSGSNASHKSTSSNPNTTSSSASNTNLTMGGGSSAPSGVGGRGKSLSGQNLGTIESGGSGSAGSYTGAAVAPRLYHKNAATTSPRGDPATISANPNYVMLDESANASAISAALGGGDHAAVTPHKAKKPLPASFVTGSNPNYQLLDESLNTTGGGYGTPGRNAGGRLMATTDNPNYEPMQAPALTSSDNPNYVLMNAPDYSALEAPAINVSDNPNYQMMQAPPQPAPVSKPSVSQPFAAMSALLRREQSRERFHNSASSDEEPEHDDDDDDGLDEEDDEDDDAHNDLPAEHMKMEKLPLNRQRSSERSQQKRSASRSRSHSQARSDERLTPVTGVNNAGVGSAARSNAFSLKEKWLMPQQSQSQTPQPPNGFIGREA